MIVKAVLLTVLLSSAPGGPPTDIAPRDTEPICASLPPAPERIDAQPFAATATDGTRSWGATASYLLSSGDVGEVLMVLGEDGTGEAQLMINGEIIAQVAMELPSPDDGPVLTTWMPASVKHPPEVIAELMRVDLPAVLAESLPQEFKCSGWAKKLLKAGKYLWTGAVAAGGVTCCITVSPGCVLCAGTAAVVGEYVHDKLENHCD